MISIIIPIYNIAQYIERCVLSVINQKSHKLDVEIILVDDGSTDNSPSICDNLASIYSNIKVIHKTNGGLSDARNEGLKLAKGKYVWFVDGDDYISKESFILIENIVKTELYDIINIAYKKIYDVGQNKVCLQPIKETNMRGIDALSNLVAIPAWTSILKREFITSNSLKFQRNLIHEDFEFEIRAYSLASQVCVLKEPLYNYVCQRPDSIMNTISAKSPIGYAESARLILVFLKEHKLPLSSINKLMKVVASGVVFSFERYFMLDRENKKIALDYYKGHRGEICNALKYHTLFYRVLGKIFKISPRITCNIFKFARNVKSLK